MPEKITIDGSDANEAAIKRYNVEHGTAIEIRQIKYLNNMVEQDHRGVKRVTRPMLGFKSFVAAQDTLAGIELMHMIKKGQMVVEEGAEGLTPAEQFYALAASSSHRPGQLPASHLHTKICDRAGQKTLFLHLHDAVPQRDDRFQGFHDHLTIVLFL